MNAEELTPLAAMTAERDFQRERVNKVYENLVAERKRFSDLRKSLSSERSRAWVAGVDVAIAETANHRNPISASHYVEALRALQRNPPEESPSEGNLTMGDLRSRRERLLGPSPIVRRIAEVIDPGAWAISKPFTSRKMASIRQAQRVEMMLPELLNR